MIASSMSIQHGIFNIPTYSLDSSSASKADESMTGGLRCSSLSAGSEAERRNPNPTLIDVSPLFAGINGFFGALNYISTKPISNKHTQDGLFEGGGTSR